MIRVVFDVRKKRNVAIDLHRRKEVRMSIENVRKEVRMSLENVRINVGASDPYEGPYVVTPSTYNDIGLQTKSKWMKEDVNVKQYPQTYVSNSAGGTTLILGEEYYA